MPARGRSPRSRSCRGEERKEAGAQEHAARILAGLTGRKTEQARGEATAAPAAITAAASSDPSAAAAATAMMQALAPPTQPKQEGLESLIKRRTERIVEQVGRGEHEEAKRTREDMTRQLMALTLAATAVPPKAPPPALMQPEEAKDRLDKEAARRGAAPPWAVPVQRGETADQKRLMLVMRDDSIRQLRNQAVDTLLWTRTLHWQQSYRRQAKPMQSCRKARHQRSTGWGHQAPSRSRHCSNGARAKEDSCRPNASATRAGTGARRTRPREPGRSARLARRRRRTTGRS
mmetsp:Transcript_70392/g.199584  ORF Transcript_70392/g.199584 Transcript_70392/m.199584 type:complete len:290 (-) Transcript_70392:249-1118(-)